MTRSAAARVGPRHARLQLAAGIAVLCVVVAAAVAGRENAGDTRATPSLAVAARHPPAVAAPPAAPPSLAPLPTPAGRVLTGTLRILAPTSVNPVPGNGMLRVAAKSRVDVTGAVTAQVYEGDRLVMSGRVPNVAPRDVRGWLRLEPEQAARPLRLRLLDGRHQVLAEMPFVQRGAEAIVLTAPFLPDRVDVSERLLVAGRVRNAVQHVDIRIETLSGRIVAKALTSVQEDRTRVPVQYVFWQSLPLDRDDTGEPLRLTVGTPADPGDKGRTELVISAKSTVKRPRRVR